jgi:hypothetical protein
MSGPKSASNRPSLPNSENGVDQRHVEEIMNTAECCSQKSSVFTVVQKCDDLDTAKDPRCCDA